ncbi:MAG: hypothetical protein ACLGH0_10470 [Thermoanaerobaculia bacterium]
MLALCIVWTLIAAVRFRRGARSAVPFAAMLVPVAIGTAGMWLMFLPLFDRLAETGAAPRSAWVLAGVADALGRLRIGVIFAIVIAIVAAMRRHRPAFDRVTVSIAIALAGIIATAFGIAATFARGPWQIYVSIAGVVLSLLAGIVAVAATFRGVESAA